MRIFLNIILPLFFLSFSSNSTESFLKELQDGQARQLDFSYSYMAPDAPKMEISGVVTIQGESYHIELVDGSKFISNGQTLWYLYDMELVVSKLDSTSVIPYHNIFNFIAGADYKKLSNGNILLQRKDESGVMHTLNIVKLTDVEKRDASFFSIDVNSLDEDIYVVYQ